jgi:hypothetical protein
MIEGDNAADDAQRFAHGEIDDIRAHRNRYTLHFRYKAGEEFHLRCRDHRVADHFFDGIAAICGVDHCQFIGVLAQDLRDPPQNLRALERQHAPPFHECDLCRGDGSVNVVGTGFCDLAQRLSSARADRFNKPAGLRLVPRASVIGTPVFWQHHRLCGGCLR